MEQTTLSILPKSNILDKIKSINVKNRGTNYVTSNTNTGAKKIVYMYVFVCHNDIAKLYF